MSWIIKVDETIYNEMSFVNENQDDDVVTPFIPFSMYDCWGIYQIVRVYNDDPEYRIELRPLFRSDNGEEGAWKLFDKLVDEIKPNDLVVVKEFVGRLSKFPQI